MSTFFAALLHSLSVPDGSDGELLSMRRKSHLLQAEWYAHLAKVGEEERKAESMNGNDMTRSNKPATR